jgi:hypothetical protein
LAHANGQMQQASRLWQIVRVCRPARYVQVCTVMRQRFAYSAVTFCT